MRAVDHQSVLTWSDPKDTDSPPTEFGLRPMSMRQQKHVIRQMSDGKTDIEVAIELLRTNLCSVDHFFDSDGLPIEFEIREGKRTDEAQFASLPTHAMVAMLKYLLDSAGVTTSEGKGSPSQPRTDSVPLPDATPASGESATPSTG